MRSLLLFSLLFLAACQGVESIPPRMLPNEECTNVKSLLVVKVFDNYILGWVNDEVPYSAQVKYEPTDKHLFFFLKEPGKTYYPKQQIFFDAPRCLVYNGNYSYQEANKTTTYLIGKLEPKESLNPDYVEWKHEQKLQEERMQKESRFQQLNEREANLKNLENELNQKEEKLKKREEYLKTSRWIERRAEQKASKLKKK